MPEPFLIFQKYSDAELAEETATRLRAGGIECRIDKDSRFFDPAFTNNEFEPTINLMLNGNDFVRAQEILEAYYESADTLIDEDYYLLSFSDEELMDIIKQPDEWGHLDYNLAKKILKQRGKEISDEQVALWKKRRTELLAKPEEEGSFWIYIGYALALLGAFFGMIIGWMVITSKKTLPDGRRVYSYSEKDRKQGRYILIISFLVLLVWLVYRILRAYNNQSGSMYTLPVDIL